MALKKSELYSSLWQSCDELHGGMDASQYKDYVLVLLIVKYVNGKFDFHQRVYKISDFSKRLDGRFFFLVFSSRFYNRIMSMTATSSVDSVRMEMIADMVIPLPSADEQRAIAELLSDMDSELAPLEARRNKTRALKQGMMQELLTGRVRLV